MNENDGQALTRACLGRDADVPVEAVHDRERTLEHPSGSAKVVRCRATQLIRAIGSDCADGDVVVRRRTSRLVTNRQPGSQAAVVPKPHQRGNRLE